jgi:hypothetical protein
MDFLKYRYRPSCLTLLRPAGGHPRSVGDLRQSSTTLDTPRRTPMLDMCSLFSIIFVVLRLLVIMVFATTDFENIILGCLGDCVIGVVRVSKWLGC